MRIVVSLLFSAMIALQLGAAGSERDLADLFECVAIENEDAVVSGLWGIESAELSPSNAALTVTNGSLVFRKGTKFQTDDLAAVKAAGGALLWQVIGNGKVEGRPELDPPSALTDWEIVVSDEGKTGRLAPRVIRQSTLAALGAWVVDLGGQFKRCLFVNQRWRYITDGLLVTLRVALCAVLLGALIGFIVAIIRSTHDKSGRLPVLNFFMKVYLTVIRGTPMAVQLLIAYFIIFASCNNKTLVAILAFGLNSGAYVAEIMRAGIDSIDPGQMEAGRSLGLSYARTMIRIILPQAVRNVLPALGNEFIVLLKDTSIASFIALQDLAKGGEIIRSQTYNVYIPFLLVAAVYLVMVIFFTWVLGILERKLRNSGADLVGNKS